MRVPHNCFVLVADGEKMLFFRNEGDAEHPNLTTVSVSQQDNPATRDQGTDQPGRSFASNGAGRSAMGNTDFHQQEEDRFAATAADMLRREALAGTYEDLIIVAPPKTLGELRKHYHKEVSARLSGEIAKDLAGHPLPEIEKILVNQE